MYLPHKRTHNLTHALYMYVYVTWNTLINHTYWYYNWLPYGCIKRCFFLKLIKPVAAVQMVN